MQRLSHENLHVYQSAIRFVAYCVDLLSRFPKGYADLVDQFRRAATSIPLNIAEGAGKIGRADSVRFFAIARGSALECGAILDVAMVMGLLEPGPVAPAKALLARVVAMLTKMTR